ncbi:MAG TPA: Hsp20 family protein [Burkholderiales bacterium]|nr:Hsp20 family protein [Burkholderiales bacterium]
MAALTRFDPFSSSIDDLFRGLLVRPVRFDIEGMPQLQIKLDVKKSDGEYQVAAELPGVKKEDIQVNVDGNLVNISAEVKKESEEKKGEQVLRSERYYGKIERSFTLDSDIDEAKVDAKYQDGVLKLKLPLKAASAAKRITVS